MNSILERFRPRPVAYFALATLAIWTNRIWLAWTNDEDTVAEKLVWSTPITLFVIASVVVLVAMYRQKTATEWFRHLVTVFGIGTVLYWIVRMVLITTGDWSVGFKVVHGVLATLSSLLAILAVLAVRHRSDEDPTGGPSPA